MSNTTTDPTCPVCGNAERGEIVSKRWHLSQCPDCTHVFTTQLPDNRRFESVDYVAWRDDVNAEFIETAQRRYNTFSEKAPQASGRALEIGCSTGEVLAEFCRNGWQGVGSDFSQAALEVARNANPQLDFHQADEQEILQREGAQAFDLIMAFHVLEHVPDIERFGNNMRKLCRPNGHLFLAFPSWEAWSRKALGDSWPDLATEHLHFFTRQSIDTWLQRSGFELVDTQSWGRAWQWLGGIKRALRGNGAADAAADDVAPQMPSSRKYKAIRALEKLMRPFLALEEYRCAGSELAIIARRVDG